MLKYGKLLMLLPAVLLLTGCANGDMTPPNVMTMLESIHSSLPSLWVLVYACCFIAGVLFSTKGLYDLHMVAKMGGTMMGGQANSMPPLFMLVLAGLFFATPTTLGMFTSSLFGVSGNVLSYQAVQTGANGNIPLGMSDIVDIVRFISIVAFVRGLFLLTRHTSRNGQPQPGTFSKAMTHIIGGVLGVNILTTWGMFMTTLGFSQ